MFKLVIGVPHCNLPLYLNCLVFICSNIPRRNLFIWSGKQLFICISHKSMEAY